MRISDWSSDVCSSDLTERDHLHILENACAKAVFVSTPKLARTLLPAVVQSSECRTVIGFEPLRIGQQSDVTLYDLDRLVADCPADVRSEEHTSELQSLMRISYAVLCLKKKKNNNTKRQE